MKVHQISPLRADAIALMEQSRLLMAVLYPAESSHLDDAHELAKPNVFFVGAYTSEQVIGIGAVKRLDGDPDYGEVKRVFVNPEHRGKGVSQFIMLALEDHLKGAGVFLCRLETGGASNRKRLACIANLTIGSALPLGRICQIP